MAKLQSAQEEVNKVLSDGKIVKMEVQDTLNGLIKTVNDFIDEQVPTYSSLSEEDKNKVYAEATKIWNEYTEYLKGIQYNVELTGAEYKYMKDMIVNKLHYNETTIFLAIKFKEAFLDVIDNIHKIDKNDVPHTLPITINDITLYHHLTKDLTVKGLSADAYLFRGIVTQIGQVYKIFNVWNKESEELSNKIYNLNKGFEPEAVTPVPVAEVEKTEEF